MNIDPSVIRQVSREKDIDAEKMFGALEEAMSSAARKFYHDKAMVTLIDRQTGSTWSGLTGCSTTGPAKGTQLRQFNTTQFVVENWPLHYPDAPIYPGK